MGVWLQMPQLTASYLASFNLLGSTPFLVIINLLLLLIIIYAVFCLGTTFNRYFGQPQKLVSLELMAPGYIDLPLGAYESFLFRVHGLCLSRGFIRRLLIRKPIISFEIAASSSGGTKFMVVLPSYLADDFVKDIQTSLEGVSIEKRQDYIRASLKTARLTEFKLKRSFYHSLKASDLSTLAYQTSFIDLKTDEKIVLQMSVRAISPAFNIRKLKKAQKTKQKNYGWQISSIKFIAYLLKLTFSLKTDKPSSLSPESKLENPLFKVNVRLLIESESKQASLARLRLFKSSLSVLSSPNQQLVSKVTPFKRLLRREFSRRLPSLLSQSTPILSAQELISLFHFPAIASVGQEMINRKLSRTLPISLSMRKRQHDVLLGENRHDGKAYPFGLTSEERARHLYVIGGTGNGKTTMLRYMIAQDIKNKKGLMVVDPHGDLAESLLSLVPKSRIADVIYFNPADIDYPIALNLLELAKGINKKELLLEKDRITETVISVFRKTFDQTDDGSAFRIERLLRNAVQTALYVDGATLFTVSRLLADRFYRWRVIENLKDEQLKRFWLEEFNKAGDYQRVKMSLGPLARLERFESNLNVRQILGQSKSTIDFDEVLSNNKIVICNLSKGRLGEDVSSLLGSVLLAKLQLAVLCRQQQPSTHRHPFYLYVDEFQNYANPAFVSMFSEARKFGLNLVIAQQSPAQLNDNNMLNVIMDNVGSLVAFRSKSSLSESIILPQFSPYLGKQEIFNLPKYAFFAKIAADQPMPPVSGRTVLARSLKPDISNLVIESSRQLYAARQQYEELNV